MRFINHINMRYSHNWRNLAIGITLERIAACSIQRVFKKGYNYASYAIQWMTMFKGKGERKGGGIGCKQSDAPRRGIGNCFPFKRVLIMRCIIQHCIEHNMFCFAELWLSCLSCTVLYVVQNLEMNKYMSKPNSSLEYMGEFCCEVSM